MTFCYMLMSTMGLVNVILNLHQPENILEENISYTYLVWVILLTSATGSEI